jgi:hypothetical protein
MLRCWALVVLVLAGCAQGVPSDPNINNGGKRDLLAPSTEEDLRGADLRRPLDLGAVDQAGGAPDDLATIEDDLATGSDPDLAQAADLKPVTDLVQHDLTSGPDLAGCAAKENCFNSLDDDCAGGVNDGCPSAISIGTPVSLGYVGGPGGGTGSIRCPAGQMAGAVRYFYDDWDGYMAGMGIFCSTPTLVKGSSSYTITATNITSVTPIVFAGDNWDDYDDSANCVSSGSLGTVWHHEIIGGTFVEGVASQCGAATVTLQSDNQLGISFSPTGTVTGGYYSSATPTTKNCPSGSVLVGYDYRIGSWMDALAPVCAPLVVTYL